MSDPCNSVETGPVRRQRIAPLARRIVSALAVGRLAKVAAAISQRATTGNAAAMGAGVHVGLARSPMCASAVPACTRRLVETRSATRMRPVIHVLATAVHAVGTAHVSRITERTAAPARRTVVVRHAEKLVYPVPALFPHAKEGHVGMTCPDVEVRAAPATSTSTARMAHVSTFRGVGTVPVTLTRIALSVP